tara:strand:- start:2788 stop:3186 length:399 start_codon:yes stop_codon:yes gene_type:complete
MLLKLKRTQKTMIGRLLMDETYRFDQSDPRHKEVAASLLKRSMAVEVDPKQHAEDLAKVKSLLTADQAAADKASAKKADADEKEAADQDASEKAATAKAAADKEHADNMAKVKTAADKPAADKAAADKAAAK